MRKEQKGIPVMPRGAQDYARAQAVCARAMEGCAHVRQPRVGVYWVDKKAAYCFGPVQAEDHYIGCYLWPNEQGRVLPHVSLRMVFGGTSCQIGSKESPFCAPRWCRSVNQ